MEFLVSRKIQLIHCWYTGFMIAEDFTQIVWSNTQSIGIDIKVTFKKYDIIILYEPRGNIPKQYVSNVFEPQSMDQGESSGNN